MCDLFTKQMLQSNQQEIGLSVTWMLKWTERSLTLLC